MPKMGWGLLGMAGGLKEWGLGGDKSWFTWGCAHKYEYGEHLAWNLGTLEVMGCTINIKQAKFSPDKWLKIPLIQIPPLHILSSSSFLFLLLELSWLAAKCLLRPWNMFPRATFPNIFSHQSNSKDSAQNIKHPNFETFTDCNKCIFNWMQWKYDWVEKVFFFFFFAEIPRLMTSLNSPVESLLSFPYLCGTALDRNFKLLTSVEEDF